MKASLGIWNSRRHQYRSAWEKERSYYKSRSQKDTRSPGGCSWSLCRIGPPTISHEALLLKDPTTSYCHHAGDQCSNTGVLGDNLLPNHSRRLSALKKWSVLQCSGLWVCGRASGLWSTGARRALLREVHL